ncbi:MAG: SHOCT domain-containing protein [Lachnospirales bacterium]
MYTKGFTHEMVINEARYYMSKKMITKMLETGEITNNEFDELDKMNSVSFNSRIKNLI